MAQCVLSAPLGQLGLGACLGQMGRMGRSSRVAPMGTVAPVGLRAPLPPVGAMVRSGQKGRLGSTSEDQRRMTYIVDGSVGDWARLCRCLLGEVIQRARAGQRALWAYPTQVPQWGEVAAWPAWGYKVHTGTWGECAQWPL